jgi:hypothetical protein
MNAKEWIAEQRTLCNAAGRMFDTSYGEHVLGAAAACVGLSRTALPTALDALEAVIDWCESNPRGIVSRQVLSIIESQLAEPPK